LPTSDACCAQLNGAGDAGKCHSDPYVFFFPYFFLSFFIWMKLARFVHLSTTMLKMHHLRADYPFGSLVDFAPDSMSYAFPSLPFPSLSFLACAAI
jgi:hypothetical protein